MASVIGKKHPAHSDRAAYSGWQLHIINVHFSTIKKFTGETYLTLSLSQLPHHSFKLQMVRLKHWGSPPHPISDSCFVLLVAASSSLLSCRDRIAPSTQEPDRKVQKCQNGAKVSRQGQGTLPIHGSLILVAKHRISSRDYAHIIPSSHQIKGSFLDFSFGECAVGCGGRTAATLLEIIN